MNKLSNKHDSEIETSRKISYAQLKGKINELEQKLEEEKIKRGRAQHGTLSRYHRLLANKYSHMEDFGLAEKHLNIAFGELKQSYEEALNALDGDLKNKTLKNISYDQEKLLKLLSIIKMSFSSTITVNTLTSLYSSLVAYAISNLVSDEKKLIWNIIIESLNHKIKYETVYISDCENLVDYIQSNTVERFIFDNKESREIIFVMVRMYQSAVKNERLQSFNNPEVAKRLALYRRESANLLKELKEIDGAIEDLAESYMYEVVASNDSKQWDLLYKRYDIELKKVQSKRPEKNRFIAYLYIYMLQRGAILYTSIAKKIELIKESYDYASAINSKYKETLKVYLYLYDLISLLKECSTITEINNKLICHDKIEISPLDNNTKNLYYLYDTARRVLDGKISDIDYAKNMQEFDCIKLLIKNNIIKSDEKLTCTLLYRLLSSRSNIYINTDMFVEDQSLANEHLGILSGYLKNEEGFDVEVKLNDGSVVSKIIESICSFANTNGGKIIVGLIEKAYFNTKFPDKDIADFRIVAGEFVLIGNRGFDKFRQDLASKIKTSISLNGIDMSNLYSISLLNIDEKKCLVIDVMPIFKNNKRLLTYNGVTYRRYDNQNRKLTQDEIIQILTYGIGIITDDEIVV